jgi:two-component system sensor histidine kinase/response regulator
MLPNERTTRSEVVALPSEMEALVAAADRDLARPLVEFLKGEKLNIAVAADAEAAFEEALLHRPNLVLIHEDLPPGGGIELCQRLKSNSRTHFLPTIFVPRVDRQPQRIQALAAGADAVFPPGMEELEKRTRLWALLRSSALQRRQERKQDTQRSALKERGRWVGTFVHDLQNVTGALQANFEFLAQTAAAASRDSSDDVLDCARETRHLFQQLTRGLRTVGDYERFESGQVTVKKAAMGVEELLAEVKEDLLWQTNGSRGRPMLEVVSGQDAVVLGDRDLLRQALSALASYLLRQPRTNRLVLRITEDQTEVRVFLSCDGEAIPPEDRERIFEPYARLSRRLPPVQGLGLALARAVVDLHGGRVAAATGEGGGAAFEVRLSKSG